MKKILSYTLVSFFYIQNLFASSPSHLEFDSDPNRLKAVLSQILDGVDINVDKENGKVVLTGVQDKITSALAKLRDFDGLRKVLLPVRSDASITSVRAMPINSWDDFVSAVGIDRSVHSLFNTSAECVKDHNVQFIIVTQTTFNRRMVQPYLDSLHESSPFFVWARKNVKEFIRQEQNETVINYGLLREFLYLNADTTKEGTATFSIQNIVKTLVATVSGNVALQPTGVEGKYRVQTLSLGESFDTRDVVLELMIDNSSSMGGSSIDFVNSKLPVLFDIVKRNLLDSQFITILLKSFNEELRNEGTYVITSSGQLPNLPKITTTGGTDLTLIESLLTEKATQRKLGLAFTDGEHTSSKSSLTASIARMKSLVQTGKFAQARLCKVGGYSSTYFIEVAEIFGGVILQKEM